MNKLCSKCKKLKEVSSFRIRNKTKGTYSSWCKICFSEYEKNIWKNSKKRRKSNYLKLKDRRNRNRKFILNYLKNKFCLNCKETNPIVLTFHHKYPKNKNFDISTSIQKAVSLSKLKKEIDKCNILCSNCHLIETAKQFKWFKINN